MSKHSEIEWTGHSWNPLRGCDPVSAGCRHCYADTLAERYRGSLMANGDPSPFWFGFDFRLVPSKLHEPWTWRRTPAHVFVNSMSDLFHDLTPFEYIDDVFEVMRAVPHCYQVLTKRAHRLVEYMERQSDLPDWIWLGVSVEDRKSLHRLDKLRSIPGIRRWASVEPLLEDLGEIDLSGIEWVVVGGESGRNARPIEAAWVRSIRDQCEAAGVKFFFKQWGGRQKAKAGRVLDGREHDARPSLPEGKDDPTKPDFAAMEARWDGHDLAWKAPSPEEVRVALRPRPPSSGPLDREELRTVAARMAERLGVSVSLTFGTFPKGKRTVTRGTCSKREDGTFRIKVASDLLHGDAVEVLQHELGHAVSWDRSELDPLGSHGPAWGAGYAKVYREFLRFRP